MRVRSFLVMAIVGSVGSCPAAWGAEEACARLEVFPAEVRLSGPEAAQRLVVIGVAGDGSRRDVTAGCRS